MKFTRRIVWIGVLAMVWGFSTVAFAEDGHFSSFTAAWGKQRLLGLGWVDGAKESRAPKSFVISYNRAVLGVITQASTTYSEIPILLSAFIGGPYALLTLIPLIGNAVVMGDIAAYKTWIGWGISGIVVGAVGLVFATMMSVAVVQASGVLDWAWSTLPQLCIHLATLILGVINVVGATTKTELKKQSFSMVPYWVPEAGGHQRAGMTVSWLF